MPKKILSRLRPTPSMAVSLLALVIALGGAGYAATGGTFLLGASNGANSATALTAKINGRALNLVNMSSKPKASALGLFVGPGRPPMTVNSSVKVANLNADTVDGLDSTAFVPAAIGGWHYVGDPGEPPFENGWVNADLATVHNAAVLQHAAFRIDNNHRVHIVGNVKTGTLGSAIFHLPASYCPHFTEYFAVISFLNAADASVDASAGTCEVRMIGGSPIGVSLQGIDYADATTDVLISPTPAAAARR